MIYSKIFKIIYLKKISTTTTVIGAISGKVQAEQIHSRKIFKKKDYENNYLQNVFPQDDNQHTSAIII